MRRRGRTRTLVATVLGLGLVVVHGPTASAGQHPLVTPEFRDAVGRCISLVRGQSNIELTRAGVVTVRSSFDAYIRPDGFVSFLGTQIERFRFRKCLAEGGHPLDE